MTRPEKKARPAKKTRPKKKARPPKTQPRNTRSTKGPGLDNRGKRVWDPAGNAKPVGELVPKLLKQLGIVTGRSREIQHLWQEVVGEDFAAATRIRSFRGGTLTVEVQSAPLLYELNSFHKKDFLKLLRPRMPAGLSSIKFKLASSNDPIFEDKRERKKPRG